MSRGPGVVEARIAALFVATRNRALSVEDIARHAYNLDGAPSRAQRSSATRAAHRILRRRRTNWRATENSSGRLFFHPADCPQQVWAVLVQPGGIVWAEADVVRIGEFKVTVRYRDELALLDRARLSRLVAYWRGVVFASSQTGRVAEVLERHWREQYGAAGAAVPAAMLMPLAVAQAIIGVGDNYTKADIIAGFRKAARKAHPDAGGSNAAFREVIAARDRLLATLGFDAPPPKMPEFAPKGRKVIYRRASGGKRRIGAVPKIGRLSVEDT
jgi:hypothetical protein